MAEPRKCHTHGLATNEGLLTARRVHNFLKGRFSAKIAAKSLPRRIDDAQGVFRESPAG